MPALAARSLVADLGHAAVALARFVTALQAIDPVGGPASEFRGMPLAERDRAVRAAIGTLRGTLDPAPLMAAWDAAITAPVWQRPAVWMHGDLHPANLLVEKTEVLADHG